METATGTTLVQEKIGGGSNYSADSSSSPSQQERREPDPFTLEDVEVLFVMLVTALFGMIPWALVIGAAIHCYLLHWLLVPTMLITYIVLVVICIGAGLVSPDFRRGFDY